MGSRREEGFGIRQTDKYQPGNDPDDHSQNLVQVIRPKKEGIKGHMPRTVPTHPEEMKKNGAEERLGDGSPLKV